jgi:hypothetical protein
MSLSDQLSVSSMDIRDLGIADSFVPSSEGLPVPITELHPLHPKIMTSQATINIGIFLFIPSDFLFIAHSRHYRTRRARQDDVGQSNIWCPRMALVLYLYRVSCTFLSLVDSQVFTGEDAKYYNQIGLRERKDL